MIVVVDDDVWFAEEIQDLLVLHGHQLVVVVTHPHDSSLTLLDQASLLILDLSLAATTALHVLEEVRRRGHNPPVVMVSGGGEDMLEAARATALARGFTVLGALPKVVAATELLKLLTAGVPPAAAIAPNLPPASQTSPDGLGFSRILAAASLDYVGARVLPTVQYDVASALPPHPLQMLADHSLHDPERIVGSALLAQRLLALGGSPGFLVVRLPDAAFLDPETRLRICAGYGYSQAALSHIVFDLGPNVCANPQRHAHAMTDLRLAGYGVLLRYGDDELLPPDLLADLPITILAVDHPFAREQAELRGVMQALRSRMIGSLCSDLQPSDDLKPILDLGFSLVGVASEPGLAREY